MLVPAPAPAQEQEQEQERQVWCDIIPFALSGEILDLGSVDVATCHLPPARRDAGTGVPLTAPNLIALLVVVECLNVRMFGDLYCLRNLNACI